MRLVVRSVMWAGLISLLFAVPCLGKSDLSNSDLGKAVLEKPGSGKLVDKIVAVVNDEVVTLSELQDAIGPYEQQIRQARYPPQDEAKLLANVRKDILNKMVEQKLADQESKRLGLEVSEGEIDVRIEEIKTRQGLTDEQLRAALAEEGRSLEVYRKWLKEQLLRANLVNVQVKSKIAITEKEIRDFYEKNRSKYDGKTKYHLSAILIGGGPSDTVKTEDPAVKADLKTKAEEAAAKLRAGETFAQIAKKYSNDPTSASGGNLGWFFLDELAPEVKDAILKMKANEVSPLLDTKSGYQILMLNAVETEPGRTLDSVRPEIQDELFGKIVEEKYSTWLKALRERSYIRINE